MTNKNSDKPMGAIAAGLATFGCLSTGVVAFIGGLMALSQNQFIVAGACLLTAVVGFGIVAHISLSD